MVLLFYGTSNSKVNLPNNNNKLEETRAVVKHGSARCPSIMIYCTTTSHLPFMTRTQCSGHSVFLQHLWTRSNN